MKIVFLDTKTIGDDIDLSGFDAVGEVVKFSFSTHNEVGKRVQDADIVIVNKAPINESTIANATKLKLVCITATGTNNLDKDYLAKRNIAWQNVTDYSTSSVAQHTFSVLFYLLEKLNYYDNYVKQGHYVNDKMFTHFAEQFHEIDGMTWGIVGLGNIGRRVANIAKAFGAKIIYYSPSGQPSQIGYEQVDFHTLLRSSDILSVHAPLNTHTQNLIDASAFAQMKPSCILLNMGRGQIVVEQALANALMQNKIAAAGLDVLCEEPMAPTNPLLAFKDSKRLLITPHIAWASIESRTRLMNITLEQIKEFLA